MKRSRRKVSMDTYEMKRQIERIERRVILLFLLTVLCVVNCRAQQTVGKIDEYMSKAVEASRFSGVVLVAQNGRVLVNKGYGMANAEDDVPNTPQTKFRVGSLTKQFTAAAILLLQERGSLDVQDSVCKYLPSCPTAWQRITIHHLLTHTSGLPDYSYKMREMEDESSSPPVVRDMEQLRRWSLEFEPGTKFSYCNSGYVLLGHIIEKASGKRYEDFVRENILDPLKMRNTGYDQNGLILKHRAAGYSLRGDSLVTALFVDMSVPFSAGGLYSTAEDLYAWEQALFTGKLLSPKSMAAMFTPFKGQYGYAWYVGKQLERNCMTHGGRIEGFMTSVDHFPDDRLTVIVLSNLDSVPANRIARDLAAVVFGQYREEVREHKAIAVDPRIYDAYVGQYELARNLTISVTREGNKLIGQAAGHQKVELFPESEIAFFAKDLDAQITFVGDGKGGVTHAIVNIDGHTAEVKKIK
jgi:CubicO group peptidase (beta-lactamase class C family)